MTTPAPNDALTTGTTSSAATSRGVNKGPFERLSRLVVGQPCGWWWTWRSSSPTHGDTGASAGSGRRSCPNYCTHCLTTPWYVRTTLRRLLGGSEAESSRRCIEGCALCPPLAWAHSSSLKDVL